MFTAKNYLNFAAAALMLAATASLTSCDNSFLYDDLPPCEVKHAVRFTWTNNMLNADAFGPNVHSIDVYVFDKNDKYVACFSEAGERLAMQGYTLPIEGLEPGEYTLVAWCGLENEGTRAETFSVTDADKGVTTRQELLCKMRRDIRTDGTHHSSEELYDLYHGTAYGFTVYDPNDQQFLGDHVYTINLTKDTNNVKIVLQQLSGADVDVSKFDFTIEEANGILKPDNELDEDELITYHPHTTQTGTAGVDTDVNETRGITNVSVGIANLKMSRLKAERQSMLTVRNDKGETVLRIPLVDYALAVKDDDQKTANRFMSDQEYLDCQDTYKLTFFLDARGEWLSSQIIINGWVMNPPQSTDMNQTY